MIFKSVCHNVKFHFSEKILIIINFTLSHHSNTKNTNLDLDFM